MPRVIHRADTVPGRKRVPGRTGDRMLAGLLLPHGLHQRIHLPRRVRMQQPVPAVRVRHRQMVPQRIDRGRPMPRHRLLPKRIR